MAATSPYEGRRVLPSILAADFARLGEQVSEVLAAGARVIHVDIMDGHFVPPITMGPLAVAAIADTVHDAGGAVEAHLMIERPDRQVEEFIAAGADGITVHIEADPHAYRTLTAVREGGARAGLALNPGTPAEAASALAAVADTVLCMTVNPGWGGQSFIASSPRKLALLREIAPSSALEVDGGIDPATAVACRGAGASVFVAGSAIFDASDPAEAYRAIADAVQSQ